MTFETVTAYKLSVGRLKLEIYPNGSAASAASANAVAERIQQASASANGIAVIFATGMSQLETLERLTAMRELPWNRVTGFHLDEYIGIDSNHAASFRKYLRQNLVERVHLHRFCEIDGSASDPERVCREYARQLTIAQPQICLLGIGDNGHLAFNDPEEANFDDPQDVKIVRLDEVSRQQQVSEGWFASIQEVPMRAITVTIPALFRVPKLILPIVGKRKAQILRRTLKEPISPALPATILRTHPDATAYLDEDAASDLLK